MDRLHFLAWRVSGVNRVLSHIQFLTDVDVNGDESISVERSSQILHHWIWIDVGKSMFDKLKFTFQ
jgi:hypothetical protein